MAVPGVMEAQKENVLIRAGDCSVTVLPHLGAKIASIRVKNRELLQAPLAPLAPRTCTMPFDAADASGWDECLPSVAACTVATEAGEAHVPDHGDLWRIGWEVVDSSDTSVELRGRCFSLPLELKRTLTLTETGKGARLHLEYALTNIGKAAAPWSWAAHPLFSVDPGDSLELPESIHLLRVEGSFRNRVGRNGETIGWPIAQLAGGSKTDMRIAQPISSEIGDKLFAGLLSPHENWCTLTRPKAGVRIHMTFDATATPYLGLWICYGGWPERPGPKQMCIAPEPATAPVDSLAQTGSWSRSLTAGAHARWNMSIDFESL